MFLMYGHPIDNPPPGGSDNAPFVYGGSSILRVMGSRSRQVFGSLTQQTAVGSL